MRNKKTIWVVFTCDEWKSHDSMRLLGAATTPAKLRRVLKVAIRGKEMTFGEKDLSVTAQLQMFGETFASNFDSLNSLLEYGHIEAVLDGDTSGI